MFRNWLLNSNLLYYKHIDLLQLTNLNLKPSAGYQTFFFYGYHNKLLCGILCAPYSIYDNFGTILYKNLGDEAVSIKVGTDKKSVDLKFDTAYAQIDIISVQNFTLLKS